MYVSIADKDMKPLQEAREKIQSDDIVCFFLGVGEFLQKTNFCFWLIKVNGWLYGGNI